MTDKYYAISCSSSPYLKHLFSKEEHWKVGSLPAYISLHLEVPLSLRLLVWNIIHHYMTHNDSWPQCNSRPFSALSITVQLNGINNARRVQGPKLSCPDNSCQFQIPKGNRNDFNSLIRVASRRWCHNVPLWIGTWGEIHFRTRSPTHRHNNQQTLWHCTPPLKPQH